MGAPGSEAVSCPLCQARFDGMSGLSAHLGGEHGLYDDEGAPASRLRPGPATDEGEVAPATWAPDPFEPGMLRYWDGEVWTTHTAPVPEPAPAPEPPPAHGLVERARTLLGHSHEATDTPDLSGAAAIPAVAVEGASPATATSPDEAERAARLRRLFPLVVVLIGLIFIALALFAG